MEQSFSTDLSVCSDFDPLAGEIYHTCFLSIEEIDFVVKYTANRETIIIAVQWLENEDTIKFLMGNLATVTVPCSMFEEDHKGRMPNFNQPRIEDYGFLIKFGDYTADLGKVLYLNA